MNSRIVEQVGRFLCLAMICWASGPLNVSGQQSLSIFAPNEAITVQDGNSYFIPFDSPGRFQQVYASSLFSSRMPPEGGLIRQLLLREDEGLGRGTHNTIPNIQLDFSTTLRAPDGLSPIFAENVGIDRLTVLGPEAVFISSFPGGYVLFDFRDNPFYYNPANGNLLVDFRINQGIRPGLPPVAILDAFDTAGDALSSLYSPDVNAPGGQASSLGLTAVFIYYPVPEPSTLALLAVGLALLSGMSIKRFWKE